MKALKGLGPHLAGMMVGVLAAVGIVYLMLNLGKPDIPVVPMANPEMHERIEAKISNFGLSKIWPRDNKAIWGEGYKAYYGETEGLVIWDSSNNAQRMVFRIRPGVAKIRGKASPASPIVDVYLTPGDRVRVPLQPGVYDVTAMSGLDWDGGFEASANVASYGYVWVYRTRPSVIAIGAPDQPVTLISRNQF